MHAGIYFSGTMPTFSAQRRPPRQQRAQAVRRNADPGAFSWTATVAVENPGRLVEQAWEAFGCVLVYAGGATSELRCKARGFLAA